MKDPTALSLLQVGCPCLPCTCAPELRRATLSLVQGWLPLTQAGFLPAMKVGHHPSFCTYFLLQKMSSFCLEPPVRGPQSGMWVRRVDALTANIFDGTRKEEASRDIAAGIDFQSSSFHITLGAAQGREEACHPRYCLHLKPPSCAV